MKSKTCTFSVLTLFVSSLLLFSCGSQKQSTSATNMTVQRIPSKFDFSPPSRSQVASQNVTMALVRPFYVGKNAEYLVPPFKEMAEGMGNDFEELLTAKGFTVRGPYGTRDEMTYNDKLNTGFILEVSIDLDPHYDRKYIKTAHKPSFTELLANKDAPTTYTEKMYGEITLSGNLVINARSPQYGELLWKKNIALQPASFTYTGTLTWNGVPSMADELNKDNAVSNTLSQQLETFYIKTLNLAWQQIDPAEMKTIVEQAKKADKKGS